MRILFLITILSVIIFHATAQELRDPVKWPFDKNSIWNKPIGSNAEYKPAGFDAARHVGVDVGHIIVSDYTYKSYRVLNSPTWGPGRCSGTTYLGFDMKVDDDWIVPDAGNSPYGNTPNSTYSYISPDRQQVEQGGKISRCETEGPVFLPDWKKWPNNRKFVDLRGDGLENGGQGASGMSSLGGTIRLGEFTSDEPIRHVIKINPWAAKYCHYSEEVPGYKWPASRADNYAPQEYNKNGDPDIVMGSLFAIPPHLTPDSLDIKTEPGRKLFQVLQDYGAYFTEDAAWDIWDIIVERDVEIEFEQEFGFSMGSSTWLAEVNKLMQAAHVVLNNTPETIGGGGEPRASLAPDFAETCSFTVKTDSTEGIEISPLGTKTLNLQSSTLLTVKEYPENYLFTGWKITKGLAEIDDSTALTARVKLLSDSVIVMASFEKDEDYQEPRDPYKWPFSKTSIWNMPIGSGARYVHAEIQKSTAYGMTIDEDIIVATPGEQLMEIYENYAGWNRDKNRCIAEGPLMFSAPIPYDFIVSPDTWDGLTPNSGLAVVMPDGRTVKQTQPFAHCTEGSKGTSRYGKSGLDIYGDGYYGMHGGSGLSAIGGALRLGELTPESGPIRHALKVNLFGKKNYYYDEQTKGYRWPAVRSDSYAEGNYGSQRNDPVKELRMGALLALPPSVDIDSLGFETEPAKIIAKALQDYGAYVVDDTAWDVYAIVTEWSPNGNFADEFKENWGFSFTTNSKNNPWARDMDRIFLNLHVVDNNSPDSIGGGGEPRVQLAPDFLPVKNISLETDGAQGVEFTRPQEFIASSETMTKIMISKLPEGYHFENWEVIEGDAVVVNPENVATMIQVNDQDSRIKANFEINHYSLTVDVTGSGVVSSDPEQSNYMYGTEIQLTANPANGWKFTEWQGDIAGTNNPVSFTLSSDFNVTAVFQDLTSAGIRYNTVPNDVKIFYDSTLEKVQFTLPDIGKESIIGIYSLQGQKIKELKTIKNNFSVSVQELVKGVYIAKIFNESKVIGTRRFVKTN